ncbi:MAG: hypothetical protein DMF71_18250 [Acidobacteria bacterium]|nr:MAG: hypothetical protein DMF71_18250 [Acidobacteriota bacterium]
MMPRRHSRLILVLLLGLVVSLVITALTHRNAPVLIWFVVIGLGFIFGIGREWFIVTKRLRSKLQTPFQVLSFLLGSYPYLAAMIVMFIFTYCVLKVLLGYHLGPYETRTIGKIVVIALATIFFGGFFILLFRFIGKLIWNRKPESNIDRGKRGDRARGSQSHSSN